MYFETYEKLKQYAALYPDRIESLTQKALDKMKFENDTLTVKNVALNNLTCPSIENILDVKGALVKPHSPKIYSAKLQTKHSKNRNGDV
ncbi:hypothetical protein [Muricomes intestini]|jgi:hypothetical protein|uniref:Uncharacterized protein n=1 Tax=Muricomes intestini TaxID=1796634 RepID=A0A4R3K552_9FIRM|nr:hypothetical protein [Muricomes intestini]TCS77903.1 hypothetical protein EDD59_11457 [Muricomes intestini]HCR81974.1 hypothetical protein [Lachnospiraceae bacterium]